MQPTNAIGIRGFTIIEMVITMVVVGVIFVVGAMTMGRAFESYDLAHKTTDVDWQGRVAMERMVRELRDVRSASATDISFAASPMTQVRFIKTNGDTVCFIYSGGSLLRGEDGPAAASCTSNTQALADNVPTNGLQVYYYDRNGAAPAAATNVCYITLTLAVTEGSISEAYRVTVQSRRFPPCV